jgi:maltooligosyltrehalose trehalohydrolase
VIGSPPRTTTWTPTLGALPSKGGAQFKVWAPDARAVDVVFAQPGFRVTRALSRTANGCFSGWVPDVAAGALYRFRLDGDSEYPDPASRFQPEGVHGPSMLVDPAAFVWTDDSWNGISRDDLTIYELHVGTFTPEGTFAGVASRLDYLASLGITAIELMPVAEAAGSRNWGYDGVDLFAPSHHYGTPDDLRRLVNAAHRHGLAVILDVVYNHLGPDGAYLSLFSAQYFTDRHPSPWGAGVNLDGEGREQVRAFFIENALHWIHEYHVDGLRLDATHALVDDGDTHFLAELADRVRASATRPVVLIAEDERNLVTLVDDPPCGYGLDGVWADDFHHHVRRALAGDAEGYFADFTGDASDLARTLRQGWFYTGQPTRRSGERRGTDPSRVDPRRMVICIQNHDQIGNRAFGDRLHHTIDLAAYRAVSALLLVAPETPLLFMGQEWAATSPFQFFTDHEPDLGARVTEGRRREFSDFSEFADAAARSRIPDPQALETFEASRLAWGEISSPPHAGILRLYRALLALRRGMRRSSPAAGFAISAVDDRTIAVARGAHLVVVRLGGGGTVALDTLTTGESVYSVVLTTEDGAFGGDGRVPQLCNDRGTIEFAGPAAVVLKRRS